jgi:hypothetical protein
MRRSALRVLATCTVGSIASIASLAEPEAKTTRSASAMHKVLPELVARKAKVAEALHSGNKVFTVVLTGGPCGGKSSSLTRITDVYSEKGWDVYALPEIPTICINGGLRYPGLGSGDKLIAFETALMKLQWQMEESFRLVAESTGKPTLLVLDRAILDPGAYIPKEDFDKVLKANHWSRKDLLARYDLVVHLVTAADGAVKFYTKANNSARSETPEQAIALDRGVRACYVGHKRHVVVGNSGDFETKVSGRQVG